MEVGGPRIDSTCFFDIPSATSSTFAFVIRLPPQETQSTRTSKSKSRESRCKIDPLRAQASRLKQSAGSPSSFRSVYDLCASSCFDRRSCPVSKVRRHVHLSHSPITKSRLPSTAGTSLTMQPGRSSGRMLRLTNDGARIFSRCATPPPLLLM